MVVIDKMEFYIGDDDRYHQTGQQEDYQIQKDDWQAGIKEVARAVIGFGPNAWIRCFANIQHIQDSGVAKKPSRTRIPKDNNAQQNPTANRVSSHKP